MKKSVRADHQKSLEELRRAIRKSPPLMYFEIDGIVPENAKIIHAMSPAFCRFGQEYEFRFTGDSQVSVFVAEVGKVREAFCSLENAVSPIDRTFKHSSLSERLSLTKNEESRCLGAAVAIRMILDNHRENEPEWPEIPTPDFGTIRLIEQPNGMPFILAPGNRTIRPSGPDWVKLRDLVRESHITFYSLGSPLLWAFANLFRYALGIERDTKQLTKPIMLSASRMFVPSPFQKSILGVLQRKALRSDALANKLGDRRRFFREKKELEKKGLLRHHPKLGFYRPDSPPPELNVKS